MTKREDFFALFDKQKSDKVLFFPDITNYYVAHRVKEGEERPFSPGQFIPDDAPIHRLRGSMPEEFKDWTCLDFYKHFKWGFPTHKIIDFGEKIVKAGNGRFILNVGDILPTNGDIYKVIELGRHIQDFK